MWHINCFRHAAIKCNTVSNVHYTLTLKAFLSDTHISITLTLRSHPKKTHINTFYIKSKRAELLHE